MRSTLTVVRAVLFSLILALVIAFAGPAEATVRYVDGDRPSSGSGLSWGEAFKTIQEAVDAAVASDEIWVKRGTYSLTSPIAVSIPVLLFGGFAGTEQTRSQRDWVSNATVVDGQGTAEMGSDQVN